MPRTSLANGAWRKVAHGLYTPAVDFVTTTQRILDVATQLTAPAAGGGWAAVGGWAAAYAWGVDRLDGVDPRTGKELPVDCVGQHLKRSSTAHVRYRRSPLVETEVDDRLGVPVTSPLRTAFDGARWAPSVEEAVVFLDAMVAANVINVDDLRNHIEQQRHCVGVEQAMRAADLTESGVRSGWESRLRVCYQLEAEMPRPQVNVPLFSLTEDFLGIADLFDPVAGLIAEFDGDQHRERRQHHNDNVREEAFESVNLTVVRSDSLDLNSVLNPDRRSLVRRLRNGRRRGLARDRSQDGWTIAVPDWWRGRIPGCDI